MSLTNPRHAETVEPAVPITTPHRGVAAGFRRTRARRGEGRTRRQDVVLAPALAGAATGFSAPAPIHVAEDDSGICAGSEQIPRCPESDRRPLWNGAPNPHFCG